MTVEVPDETAVAWSLAVALGGCRLVPGKARHGYARCEVVQRGDDALALVFSVSPRAGEVHITTSSVCCDEVVPVLRRLWPAHRVSRVDSSVDLDADFDRLDPLVCELAEPAGVYLELITSTGGGATRYVGSPSSEVRMRLYKKSEQLARLHPERVDEIRPGVVRFELQVRPNKRTTKERAADMSAEDVWGFSRWSRALAELVLSVDAERVSTHFRRPADHVRALHFLGRQYGPAMAKRAAAIGVEAARAEVLAALGL